MDDRAVGFVYGFAAATLFLAVVRDPQRPQVARLEEPPVRPPSKLLRELRKVARQTRPVPVPAVGRRPDSDAVSIAARPDWFRAIVDRNDP